jgi:cation:H+ antiporter
MIWVTLAIVVGLPLLIVSAERFIQGAASTAGYFGIPPSFIGIFYFVNFMECVANKKNAQG